MTKFNATVTTVILNGEAIELKDRIEFNGVDHGFIDYLAGSCRLVARKLFEGAQDPPEPTRCTTKRRSRTRPPERRP
ncbi:hypothetical protein [Propionivibrio sp.]|uniref:hypothetical protein n=1 Tax=Propionivibrio sp. TaxID=2212460 RepID=UPI0025F1FC3B|nr:hypothetical protein [Propionivibrio sp.]MBK7357524.1 hypothetical protein [Propionivibrio sp.]